MVIFKHSLKNYKSSFIEIPNFIKKLESKKIKLGGNVSFVVVVSGEPDPDVMWKKDGKHITKSSRINFLNDHDTYSVILNDITDKDAGIYSVVASNTNGEIQSDASLDVYGNSLKKRVENILHNIL